ncbi:MAG: DUF4149 domain-containing protein [Acidobacteria bacterium]|nr:DUF4149 domain-containing protein [Acidobacteriota bacterium]
MRLVAALHDLSLAFLTGGLAGVFVAVDMLFDRAPSREIAGQVGVAIFGRIGPSSLALAAILLGARIALHGAERPGGARRVSLVLALVIAASCAAAALYLTPRMSAIWIAGAHAGDGAGLTGDDRSRFLAMHIASNLAYLAAMISGAAMLALRAFDRR